MRKLRLLFCFFVLLCTYFHVNAQGNCPWNVNMNVIEATCLNNGGVEFFLLTDNGDTIAIDIENKKPVDPSINLSEIKFYHQSLTNLEDTTTYYTPNPRIFLKPGTYRVGVQAQCYNGGEGSGAYTPLSYEEIIDVVGSYTVPTVAILANTATNSWSSGNRPTVPCGNTGRIQLKITDGSMPYSLVLVNSITKDTVRTKYITRAEGHSTDTLSADFKDLYTFDTLPAGSYRLYFSDACDFKDSAITWTVENIKIPQLTSIIHNPYNYNTNYNVFSFSSAYLSRGNIADYLYDYYAQNVQYRVCYGTKDTSDWKAFPLRNLYIQNDNTYYVGTTIYDTARHISKYCEIEGEYLTFQYRISSCENVDTIISYFSSKIKPYSLYITTTDNEEIDYSSLYYDSCNYHIPGVHANTLNVRTSYLWEHGYNYGMYDYVQDYDWNILYHSYATFPVTYTLTDTVTGQVIKSYTANNTNLSRLTIDISEIEAIYGEINGHINLPLKLERTDSKGCVYSYTNNVYVHNEIDTIHGNHWLSYDHDYSSYTCCSNQSYFHLYERFSANREQAQPSPQRYKQTRDGAKFQITKSPRNNKYNMTATYHFDTDSWTVEKESELNNAEIESYENEYFYNEDNHSYYEWGINVKDYCIPYGQYDFRLITDCDTMTYDWAQLGNHERRIIYEKPAYTTYQECDNYFITLDAGRCKYQNIGSTNDEFQDEYVEYEQEMNTFFKIISGPANGYPTNDFQVGETIRLTIPGTYTLRMYSPDNYCESAYFDTTITYTGGTVSFDYAYAYVCDADSTVGFFYCQAKDGMAPYTYRLYELTNMEGNLLEENSTGSFKGLSNIHVGDMMSLEVGDACGRSYYVNITVTDLSSSRLAWFDGALRVTETCEGSEIDVYISAVEEDFTYHWKGPNGFDVTTPRGHIVIGRGSEPGDYTVEIGNTGCSQTLKDTVTLGILPAPKVEMSYGTNTVCPGQNVTLSFTPTQGTGTITYIIGREINSIDTFYNFSGIVGETASLEYTATSEATFWIHKVEDEICNYTIPEDTVKITLRDAATACDVTVSSPQICFDATAELTASSSTMVKPYTIRWYDNPYQQNVLKTDVIEEGMSDASFTTGKLQADSTLYVTIQDATHCETYTGTVNQWMNMDNGTTPLTCGQSIRLFDDGGSNGNYLSGKYYKHTFTSTDGNLITLSFNSFNTQLNGDVMRVYTGAEVLQDSLLALISGSNLPESFTSNGTSMTIVFVSNSATEAEGWDALVSCSALPAQANIKVLEDLSVTLSISPEMPARYGQSYTLTAVANGGQGSRYEFTWHITDKDYNEIQSSSHELASNTDIYNLDNLTETRNVWVVVKDKSDYPCTTKDKMSNLIQIEIADIALNLELSSTVNEICQGDIPMIVKIKNEGSQTANNVKVKLALPDGMSLTDEADSLILFPEINAQGTVYDTLFIRNEAHVSTSTSMDIRAQIWSCNQGDNNSNWHNWDWTGNPNEADESIYTLTIRPSLDIVNAPGLTVSSADICFGGDATIQAHSNLDYPQHFIWYADAALTQVIKDTTLENNTSIIVSNEFTNITQEGALCYVMVENSNYCPAYTTVDYRTKMQYAPTDTILMHNGSSMVGNADHIRFFDDGGADNNYAPNKRYGYLFTSVDGSPLAIYFDENNYIYNYNNNARIEIYDGESDMTPRIARYTNSQMRDKVLVATTGKMFIKFYSDDYPDQGISAHVFTTSRAMVAEADVTFKTPMTAENITTSDDRVCYGNNATLTASANINFPQTHFWYDENLNPIDTIPVTASQGHSSLPVSSVTHSTNYYVTISNNNECPVIASVNGTSSEREVRLDAEHDGETTIVTPNETINFYDEGGRNGSYHANNNYTHTFTALQGKLNIIFNSCEYISQYDTLFLYDGEDVNESTLLYTRGDWNYCSYKNITTTGSNLTVRFKSTNNASGWWAQITSSNPENSMAVAKASVKAGVPESITTDQEVAVCFGSDAVLSASSSLSTYPQYFYWYNADRTEIVHRDTVENSGESSSYSITPTSETFYYVTVTNSDNCPINESQLPQDTDNLIKIKVTFSEPVISNNVTVNDDVVCYGQNASLTATTNDGTEKHIYWYDENFHLINDEIGTSSTIEPQVSGNTVYYVNAVETNECGILPPSYGKFFFDASKNGGTTNLTTGEMIPFYDAGGPNANYNTPGADWTHTFVAPAGKQVTLKMNSFYTSGHRLFIYDGNTNNLRREFNGNYGENMNGEPITSTTGKLIVRWFIDYNPNDFNYPGWEGKIGVLDANGEMHVRDTELATAHVSMKSIADQLASITTTDATVCYGSEATLTASSTIDHPQTFYWFNSSRDSILRQQTIDSGHDSFTTLPTTEGSYYVYVTNSQNCPLPTPIHDEHIIVNMGNSNTNSYSLTEHNIIDFYDAGGINDNYNDCWGGYYYFNAPVGTRIHIHFNNIQLEENSYLQLALSKADNNSYEHKELRGTLSDTDFVSEGNYVQIYFWNSCNEETAAGWDGYIYAETPIDIENLVAANVTFEQPTFSQNVSTNDVEACYGDEITLTASNIGSTSRYAWYDENYNLIFDTIGVNSQFSMIANSNTTYYVNASAADECPVMPPHYGEFWFDASQNGDTTYLTEGTAISFYDAGGPNANYNAPNGANWTHYFVAPAGKEVTLKLNNFYTSCNHYLLVLDGFPADYSPSSYSCDQGQLNQTIHCTTGVLTIQWYCNSYDNNTYPGWDGVIGVLDANDEMRLINQPNFAEAHVTVKAPIAASEITTTDARVCFGNSATLTASAPNLAFPQTHIWYDENLNEVRSVQVEEFDGYSYYTVDQVEGTAHYYVSVSNETECPVRVENDYNPTYRNVRMGEENGLTIVQANENITFTDQNGNSETCGDTTDRAQTFTAAQGHIYISMGTSWDIYLNNEDTLFVYDGNSTADPLLWKWAGNGNFVYDPYFTSSGNSLTVRLKATSGNCYSGWRATVHTTAPQTAMAEATVTVLQGAPASITSQDVVICYGDDALLEASSNIDYDQTFTWYGPDRDLVLDQRTIQSGNSTITVHPTAETTYYVSVANANTCSGISYNFTDVLMNGNQTNYDLTPETVINFYDAGGPDNNYQGYIDYYYYFNAPQGSTIHFHLNNIEMENNSNAYMEIYEEEHWNQIAYINSSQTDRDYLINTSRLRVHFYNGNGNYNWKGSIKLYNPVDTNSLKAVHVTFTDPVIADNIQVDDKEACYGETATLTVNNYNGNMQYVWFDENMELAGTGETLDVTVTENTTYYVNAGVAGDCIIPSPEYSAFVFNEAKNGGTTQLTTGVAIPFYDDGGIAGDYAANANWTHTFVAPQGKQVTLEISSYDLCDDWNSCLYIYDGTSTTCGVLCTLRRYSSCSTVTSYNGALTLQWVSNNCTAAGWEGRIGVKDANDEMVVADNEFTAVHVNLKAPVAPSNIATNSPVEVCYGSETTLTASTNISYPQTYTWYGPDRTIPLYEKTITSGQCNYTFTPEENVYYVYVTNSENCPPVTSVHNEEMTVLMDGSNNSHTLTEHQLIHFYDAGGINNNYNDCWSGNYYFYAPEGTRLRLHFNSIALEDNTNTYLRLYMRNENGNWEYQYIYGNVSDTDFVAAAGSSIEVYFSNYCNSETAAGWDAYVYAMKPLNTDELASVQVNFSAPSFSQNVSTNDVEGCYGETVTLTATNGNGTSNYAWYDENMNFLGSNQTGNYDITALGAATYYVNASSANECPVIPPSYNGNIPQLTAAHVSIKAPVGPSVITTTDGEGCYGGEATLTATSTLSGTQHFYWYDGLEPAFDETVNAGEASHFVINNVTGTKTYYVTVGNGEECPVFVPETLGTTRWINANLDEEHNGTTTMVMTNDQIDFYDEGGSGSFTSHSYTRTFKALQGQLYVENYDYVSLPDGDVLYVYDGEDDSTEPIAQWSGSSYPSTSFTTTGSSVTFKLVGHDQCCWDGWHVVIRVANPDPTPYMAEATVTLKAPLGSNEITTTNGEACRGGEVVLTASANIDFPQTHIWYDEDMNFLGSYLVEETDEHSSYTVSPVTRTQNYYVSVGNATECLVNIVKTETLNLNESTSGGSTEISDYKRVKFYDMGGKQGSYGGYNNTLTHSFTAPTGQQVYVTFSDDIHLNDYDNLRIYNGYVNDNDEIAVITRDNQYSAPRSYNSTSNILTFVLEQNGSCCEQGWEATVTTSPTQQDQSVLLNYDGGTTIVNPGETVEFYDGGGANNNAYIEGSTSYTHTFTASSGKLKLTFKNYYMYLYNAHLYVYNGTEANSDSLLAEYSYDYSWNDNNIPEFISSGSSLTVKLQNDYSWGYWFSGWSAEVSAPQPELAMATASIKAPLGPSEVTTTDGQACKGQPATMTASADIDYPQYYTWYDEDYMAIHYDTLHNDGEVSSYTIDQVTHAQNYYVAVSNATECPVEFIRTSEILLNSNTSGLTTEITDLTPTYFYDKGGKDYDYDSYDGNTLTHTFTAPEGQQVYVTFSNEIYLNYNDHLRIYNGTANGDEIVDITQDNQYSVSRSFHSTTNTLTFILEQGGNCCNQGWKAIVATSPMQPNPQVLLNSEQNGQTTHLGLGETIGLYDNGGYYSSFGISSGEQYTHTFTADQGKIQISFKDYIRLYSAKLYVYDGTTANDQTLLKQWQYDQDLNEEVILTSSGSSLTVRLSSDDYVCCPEGWRAEVTALPELAVASVSVKVVDPSSVVTTDAEICYGDSATLTASSDIAVPQYYFWYGPDRMNVEKYDTVWTEGGHSEFDVLTGAEETYYVTVTNDTTCQFVEQLYTDTNTVLMGLNGSSSPINQPIDEDDFLLFYDAGGPNGSMDFPNGNCWNQELNITAPEGSQIRVHLNSFNRGSGRPYMYIYKYVNGYEEQVAYIGQNVSDKDYIIESNHIRLTFSNNCESGSFPGWDGYIYAIVPRNANELAEAHVSFKTPVGPSSLTTNSPVKVCYGSEATLTASSTLDADQYFTWYDSDRINILKRDTIHTQGQNSWVTLTPEEEGNYYVAVTNANNCPIIENLHTHYAEVLIGNNYQLLPYDSIGFFDDGGRNENYGRGSYRSSSFTAENGSHIRIHIDTISLARRASLRIRDEENNRNIVTLTGPIDTANLDFIVESNRVYCNFDNDKSNLTAMGWNAYIYAITPHNEDELVEVNVEFIDPVIADQNDVTVTDKEACYGETVTLTATVGSTEPQHFVWYDEESNVVKDEVSTGSNSLTVVATEEAFYYVNVSSPEECPVLPPYDDIDHYALPYGHITIKAGVPATEITTVDDEVCFGSEATLTATSDIDFPQYYTWFAPDRITILKQETVTAGGHSTLTVTPDEETDYYVAITNDENCPIVEQIHNRLVEVMMNNQNNSYDLSSNDSVRFYDTGGKDGDYWTDWGGDFYFNAEEGSHIRIHFDTVQLARNAYIQIYNGDNSNNPIVYITGSRGNLDTIVESNRVRIYFSGYSNTSAPGWEAYVYSLNPRDEDELASAHVSFMQPTFNSGLITTTNTEGCLGDGGELSATSTLSENQYFAWYDSEMNQKKQEVVAEGEYSTLPVEVLGNTTYYVNVSGENECPVLPPHYGEFWFNASVNGGTTNLEAGEAVLFFDAAGPDRNYNTPGADWTHTFIAPEGRQVRVNLDYFEAQYGHRLKFYNGTTSDDDYINDNYFDIRESCCYSNDIFTSPSNVLTIRWQIQYNENEFGNHRGWDGLIGVLDDNGSMSTNTFDFAEATVSAIQPTVGLPITTSNDTVCYGSEAHLTASSTIDYPQYYTWYAPDARTILLCDTVDGTLKTLSTMNAPHYYQYQDQNYYVAIGNEANCPPVIAEVTNTKTVLLNSDAHGQTTTLAPNEVAKFYDAGGSQSSYYDHNSDYTHTFQASQGNLRVKFVDNNAEIGHRDTLYVYDGPNADETHLIGKVVNEWDDETDERVMNYDNVSFVSSGSYMTFRFESEDSWNSGWNATVMPYNLENDMATAKVNVKISSVPEMAVTTVSDTVCYGSAATISASADLQYPQYYTWYNSQMEVLKQDTLTTGETESVLSLPTHYYNETYYAYVSSDTVSCILDMSAMPKITRELCLTRSMDGGETSIGPNDSIIFISGADLVGTGNSSYSMRYNFTTENGLIQIHFDELELADDAEIEFEDPNYDIEYSYYYDNILHDLTITSLSNKLQIYMYIRSSYSSHAQWHATVTNVNVANTSVLSKMAQADVVVKTNNSVATVSTTNDTVCIGSPAILTASSNLGFPQSYTWYNDDMSQILHQETIESGISRYYVPGQMGNSIYRVQLVNDTICAVRPVEHHTNFREYNFDDDLAGQNLFVSATDSLVIYDDGGKFGNYEVPENESIRIIKLETYPNATITAQVTSLETDAEEEVMLAFVNGDEQGNLNPGDEGENVSFVTGTLNSTFIFNSTNNVLYIGWLVEDEDALPMAGFEMTVTADMHPESYLADAHVVMRNNLPMDYNAITDATSTIICQGDNAELEATSNLTENPQYFLWYSSDLSRVLGADTVYSGNVSHVSIPNLMQDTLMYVAVGTDEVCPAYPVPNKLINEVRLTQDINADTTVLTAIDSVLFFDEGGPNAPYSREGVMYYHTFKAASGHVTINMHEISISSDLNSRERNESFLAVLEGELEEDNIIAQYAGDDFGTAPTTITSTGNSLTVVWVCDWYDNDDPHDGWFASVYTTEQINSDMSVLAQAEVTVNPSYQFEVYDTTNASRAPYSTADNMFRNIDVSAEGELIIDSVFHTALGCDSTYTLHLMVLPATVQDIVIASNSNSWTYDGWYHREEVYTVVYGLDTLTADAGSDGKVFTMPGTGDILTITPDATAEVIYFTPTPVPNSFSYDLDNETDYPSVTTDTGTLEITPIATEITITANSASKYYDGTPLTNDGFTYTPTDILVEGDTLVAEIVGTITEIGDSLNRVVSYQVLRNVNFNRRGLASYTQDVTNCYTFALPVSGTLSIVDTFTVSCEVVNGGRICPGSNDGTATITIEGGKDVSPDRYEYSIVGDNTGYNNTGHTEGEIILNTLSPDSYTVTATDALGLTATATFSIVERPVITTTTVFECPNNIDTVIKHSGCNITLMDIGTPNFVAPTGMDMADVTIYNNAPADHIYEVGETTVTWVAKGMCGDSITCDQIIKVSFQACPDAVDFEGNSYPSVRLGSGCKCWTTENLVSTKYSDGRDIDEVMDYYSYEYPDVATNVSIFGHLYNWYAAADTARYGSVDSVERAYHSGNHIQGICPDGWYLPSDEEYDELNIYPTTDLRSTEYWIRVNGVVNTNATGFNSLPGGMYNCSTGRFESMMGNSYYWTCHPVYDLATGAMIDYICEKIVTNNNSRCNGYSIRCIWGE